ncbi:MAG: hypothetical protein P4L83_01315 [Nevskia sp.]|nr:hypothetical protein [Nevskia sp.]
MRGPGLLLAGAVGLLCGCAMARAHEAYEARSTMVGMSRAQVLACMGIPQARQAEGNLEVWSYASGNGRTTGVTLSAEHVAVGGSEGRFCTVNVNLTDGVVSAVNYVGPTGGLLSKGEQCAYVVENCLDPPQAK